VQSAKWSAEHERWKSMPPRTLPFSFLISHFSLIPQPTAHCLLPTLSRPPRKKKAPGKAASQGGRGHITFPGAIGRTIGPLHRAALAAELPSRQRRSVPQGILACGLTLRGPQERACRQRPQVQTHPRGGLVVYRARPNSGRLTFRSGGGENTGLCRDVSRPFFSIDTRVPLLAERQAVPSGYGRHCFCEAVAHCGGVYRGMNHSGQASGRRRPDLVA
jgi:hypothetical protein